MDVEKRKFYAILNRITIPNICECLTEISNIIDKSDRKDLFMSMFDALEDQFSCIDSTCNSFIISSATLLAFMYQKYGAKVAALLKMKLINLLFDNSFDSGRKNWIFLTAYLVLFQIISTNIVIDIAFEIIKSIDEHSINEILVIFRVCGLTIRNDEPEKFRLFCEKLRYQAENLPTISFRLQFMLESIEELRLNRSKLRIDLADYNIAKANLHKTMNEHRLYTPKLPAEFSIHASEASRCIALDNQEISSPTDKIAIKNDFIESVTKKICSKGSIQKSFAGVILTSKNVADAFETIMKLRKGKPYWDYEIISLIIKFYIAEKDHNPFYVLLLCKIGSIVKKFGYYLKTYLYNLADSPEEFEDNQVNRIAVLYKRLLSKGLVIINTSKLENIASRKARILTNSIKKHLK